MADCQGGTMNCKKRNYDTTTLKEAVLKSLEDINDITNYLVVLNYINDKNYYDFGGAKTPGSTVSAVLGDFIRNGDTRVKRIKQDGGTYSYYLTKNEQTHPIPYRLIGYTYFNIHL